MASIKQLDDRRFKITVSNGYRPDGKKICKAKTIRVPESIPKRGIPQYVAHEAEELERQFKTGYSEDGDMTFQEFAERWLARQVRYAPARWRATGGCWRGCIPSSGPSPSTGSGRLLWRICW